jgi:hypothetical protein
MKLSDQVLESQAQLFGMSKEELRAARSEEAPPQPPAPQRPPMPPPMPQAGPARQPAPPRRPAPEPQDDFSDQNIVRGNAWNDRSSLPPAAPSKQDGKFLSLYDDEDGR